MSQRLLSGIDKDNGTASLSRDLGNPTSHGPSSNNANVVPTFHGTKVTGKGGGAPQEGICKLTRTLLHAFELLAPMSFTNEQQMGWSRPTWKVRRTLERNRALLKALRSKSDKVEEEANAWLVRRGFDFDYHTHLKTSKEGKVVVMCFDEGYTIDKGTVKLQ